MSKFSEFTFESEYFRAPIKNIGDLRAMIQVHAERGISKETIFGSRMGRGTEDEYPPMFGLLPEYYEGTTLGEYLAGGGVEV